MPSKRDKKKLRNRALRRQRSQQSDVWVLNSGFLLQYDKKNGEIIKLGLDAHKVGLPIWVPAHVVSEVLLNPDGQIALKAFLKFCLWHTNDRKTVESVARLRYGATKQLNKTFDLADVSVVVVARSLAERYPRVTVFTSDPGDILALLGVAAALDRINTSKKSVPKTLGSIIVNPV